MNSRFATTHQSLRQGLAVKRKDWMQQQGVSNKILVTQHSRMMPSTFVGVLDLFALRLIEQLINCLFNPKTSESGFWVISPAFLNQSAHLMQDLQAQAQARCNIDSMLCIYFLYIVLNTVLDTNLLSRTLTGKSRIM